MFPVLAYVGGPNELAYQIYALALFDCLDLPKPALLPRYSVTLLDSMQAKIIERLSLSSPLTATEDDILSRSKQPDDPFVKERLAKLEDQITETFTSLAEHLTPVDRSLASSLPGAANTLVKGLAKTRKKIDRVLANHAGTGTQQLKKLASYLCPRNGRQERTMATFQLLTRHGLDLGRHLRTALDPWKVRHVLLVAERSPS